MKKLTSCSLLLLLLFAASCGNTWNQDDQQAFHQACMDDATKWAGSEAVAKTYCDCVVTKVMTKYPNVADAVEHIDVIAQDPELRACRPATAK